MVKLNTASKLNISPIELAMSIILNFFLLASFEDLKIIITAATNLKC